MIGFLLLLLEYGSGRLEIFLFEVMVVLVHVENENYYVLPSASAQEEGT